jgi:YHS domain-containing protein
MNSSKKHFRRAALAAAFVLVGLIMVQGCKKSEPEPTTPAVPGAAKVAEQTVNQAMAAIEQTTCPVMGGATNKAIFTEYKGKKVYFCCDPCKEKFEAAPKQYVAKLPQFNQ